MLCALRFHAHVGVRRKLLLCVLVTLQVAPAAILAADHLPALMDVHAWCLGTVGRSVGVSVSERMSACVCAYAFAFACVCVYMLLYLGRVA
jgi:hypothetical protein